MKIAHYLNRIDLAEGGVVRAVLDLCAVMAARGHAVTLLTHDPQDIPSEWEGSSAPRVVQVRPPTRRPGLFDKDVLAAFAERFAECDVVHLHTPWDPANLQLASIARRLHKPYVLTVHGMLDDWSMGQKSAKKRLYHMTFAKGLLERAALVHCTAQAELAQARRWIGRGRGVVVPLLFDTAPFESLPGPERAREHWAGAFATGRPVLLFLSRLHPKKGVHVLLDAVANLERRGMAVEVVIAGTGDEPYTGELRSQAERLGLTERVHFVGLVTGELKVSLYQAADLFVLPTSQENFGFVLPEALACGTPVVTTRGVDIWPELESSGGAVIADHGADAIADSAYHLAASPEKRAAMGEAGRAWVLAALHPDVVAGQFVQFYERAIEAGGKR